MDEPFQKPIESVEEIEHMSLLEKNKIDCCTLVQTEADDEAGGYRLSLVADKHFKAAIIIDIDNTILSADATQLDTRYKVITKKEIELHFHDIVQKENTGECLRIISTGDKKTPKGAGLNMVVYTAEPYEIEKGGENE